MLHSEVGTKVSGAGYVHLLASPTDQRHCSTSRIIGAPVSHVLSTNTNAKWRMLGACVRYVQTFK